MAILGNIIKGFIDVKESFSSENNPVKEQQDVLKKLLTKAQDTAFGKHYGFKSILEAEDPALAFKNAVPYFDYNKINEEWWYRLQDGEENVTWPGHPKYFALSSGTTGKASKRIPVTDEMIDAIKDTGIQQVFALSNFDFPADFFEK